jgi:hypothetical protein
MFSFYIIQPLWKSYISKHVDKFCPNLFDCRPISASNTNIKNHKHSKTEATMISSVVFDSLKYNGYYAYHPLYH